ncbi:hypothetical protein BpHYR1_030272 [Brachionus plicatilis]|uniref:Uncharacterized protein n=1 Tax=Brachionus plicatilis TaxID=10195 RepID=A0A3M7SPV4_BRAPC|nr:hypothetical protein BpHYR1_030272 [Brachionus plicatilis]
MGSKNTKTKQNSISALEDNSFQTKINTQLNAQIGKIIDDLVKLDDKKPAELICEEKENLSFQAIENSDDGLHLVNEVVSTKPNEQEDKTINPILVSVNNENSIKHRHSFRVKRLQKRSESENNNVDSESEINFKKSKRKGVRFSDDVIVINDHEREFLKSKQKNSPPKTEYIRLVSLSKFEVDHLKSKQIPYKT